MMPPTQSVSPTTGADDTAPKSPNFAFLAAHHRFLVRFAAQAERYLFDDSSTALFKLRQFAELLAQQACAYVGVFTTPEDDLVRVLSLLRDRRAATPDVLDLFQGIRKAGNAAVHEGKGTRSEALHHLRMARQLAVWFHRAFGGEPGFRPGPFLPPPDPAQAGDGLRQKLERLRQQVVERRQAEQTAQDGNRRPKGAHIGLQNGPTGVQGCTGPGRPPLIGP